MIDVLLINPGNAKGTYQGLAKNYSAIESPTWALLLAQSCRSIGFKVAILDVNAEQLEFSQVLERIQDLNPRFICFVVYGQNVNAGTTNMSGATKLSNFLKEKKISCLLGYIGSHVQALPVKTMELELSIDIVFTNEGVYSLRNILELNEITAENLSNVKGIAYRSDLGITLNPVEIVVPQEKMDIDLPGYAWDLLPYDKKPFDLYRAPMWHAEYDTEKRTPYAAIQTSLGCKFGCDFCMINMINRNNNNEIGVSGDYSSMRWWSPEFIIKEIDKLIDYGVKTIRIVDEMFLLNPKYYIPLCELLKKRNLNDELRMWAYTRVDTVKKTGILKLVRSAGIKWLCLGIESSKKSIRLEISKGKFEDVNVENVVDAIHEADINVMANYIFGLPGDTEETIMETLNLSKKLCTVGWNTYAAMALPGTKLYKEAIINQTPLPDSYEGYSFHSFETLPLRNKNLSAKQILEFRDKAFTDYHTYQPFLNKVKSKFGKKAVDNIIEMTKVKLNRKIFQSQ
ncbi:radical SAM protein [Pelagibacteraceae bacterium]|nr:radical SAM protein [Pelagibacteraceae bacterium]